MSLVRAGKSNQFMVKLHGYILFGTILADDSSQGEAVVIPMSAIPILGRGEVGYSE